MTSEGGGDEELAVEEAPASRKFPVQRREVLLHQRLQRGVDDAGRGASITRVRWVQLVGEVKGTPENARRSTHRRGAHERDDDRPDKLTSDRLHVEIPAPFDRATTLASSEGNEDAPHGNESCARESQTSGTAARRARIRHLAEGIVLSPLAQQTRCPENLCGEEGGAGDLALDDGVSCAVSCRR